MTAAVANGEKSYGVLVDFMAFNAKAKGSPIDFVFPAEGNPAVTEPVAILKTTQNAAAARAFVDFILSDEGQKLAVSMGAEVTVFSTSPSKEQDARALGAHNFVVTKNPENMAPLAGKFKRAFDRRD